MKHKAWHTWGKRLLTLLFIVLIPALLYMLARNLDWNEVRQSLVAYKPSTLIIGLGLALCSYLTFAGYDLLARAYTGHHLPARQVLPGRAENSPHRCARARPTGGTHCAARQSR